MTLASAQATDARGSSHDLVDPIAFRLGMRQLASGVSLVVGGRGDERHGLLATSLSSLSDAPPSLIVCISRSCSSHQALRDDMTFGVSLLGQQHRTIAKPFSLSSCREERFKLGSWGEFTSGTAYLTDALAAFDCEVEQIVDFASHAIFIAKVRDIKVPEEAGQPMIYYDRAFMTCAS